eukprot:scaffold33177_cov67-Skeletonema_dohrnii-CCMP3373.AAC.2
MSRSNVKVKCQGQMSRFVKVLALEAVVAHGQQYAKLLEETMTHLKKKKPRLIESDNDTLHHPSSIFDSSGLLSLILCVASGCICYQLKAIDREKRASSIHLTN